jgi:quercetin dioxygenase-like cupin family protein
VSTSPRLTVCGRYDVALVLVTRDLDGAILGCRRNVARLRAPLAPVADRRGWSVEFGGVDDTQGEPPGEWPQHFEGRAKLQRLPNPLANGPAVFAVHFEPGGRTRPHVHRSGQLLYIVAGRGIVGDESGRHEVGPGDVVASRPGEWHWHGATPDSPMTHLTVQVSGDPVEWDVDEKDWAEG